MAQTKPARSGSDPFPYDGPIQRVDGRRPFNRYLWPMSGDWFWAYDAPGLRHIDGRWNIKAIALDGGKWLADGFIWETQYDTREAALRASAANLLRTARGARSWPAFRLRHDDYVKLVAWTFSIVGRPAPKVRPLPVIAPPPPYADLPLFAGFRN